MVCIIPLLRAGYLRRSKALGREPKTSVFRKMLITSWSNTISERGISFSMSLSLYFSNWTHVNAQMSEIGSEF